jgi:lipopolysaccharide transport system ATP-binding protein
MSSEASAAPLAPTASIRVAGLGKRYRLGQRAHAPYLTLRERLAELGNSLWRRPPLAPSAPEFWALREVSFTIAAGERVGVIGRNGAGKSTLLKLLSRIAEPTTGRIELRGRVASLLEVGTGFHGELTGRENIFLNGTILGMTRAEIRRKFDAIVAFAEIERFLDTPVKRYSSGMYVRLAFAVAAHLEPEILLVDEVLAVGDVAFQRKCLGKMHDIARQDGRTVLFVTHNLDALRALCPRTLVLESGRILHDGETGAAIACYLAALETAAPPPAPSADLPRLVAVQVDPTALVAGRLVVTVAFRSPFPLRGPNVGLVVSDALGRPVFGTNTKLDLPAAADTALAAGTARLEVQSLPLRGGLYRIDAWLGDRTQDYHHLPAAAVFEFVAPGFREAPPPIETIGATRVDARWTLDDTPPAA